MKYHKSWARTMILCFAMTLYTGYKHKQEDKEMIDCFKCKRIGLLLGGVLFGTAGVKMLVSTDTKKFYINCLAASLRTKDCVMTTVTSIQEDTEDILVGAKEINVEREQEEMFEDESGVEDQAVSEEMVEEPVDVVTE